nr:vegetative cell wall protein gp1-like [Aegilops tauschii subsp. strangulata]
MTPARHDDCTPPEPAPRLPAAAAGPPRLAPTLAPPCSDSSRRLRRHLTAANLAPKPPPQVSPVRRPPLPSSLARSPDSAPEPALGLPRPVAAPLGPAGIARSRACLWPRPASPLLLLYCLGRCLAAPALCPQHPSPALATATLRPAGRARLPCLARPPLTPPLATAACAPLAARARH